MILDTHSCIHKLILCEIDTPDGPIYQDVCSKCCEKIGNPKDMAKFPPQELKRKYVTTEKKIFEERAKYLAKQASNIYSSEWHKQQEGKL